MYMFSAATSTLSAGGCDQHAKRRREEPPHVRGQGQQLRVPDCDGTGTAERSYPASEVGGEAERRYPVSEVRGGDERSYPTSEVRAAAGRR